MERAFSLISFNHTNIPDMTIKGTVSRQNNTLAIRYTLAGKIESIRLPAVSASPARKDELWKGTCFELFLAIKDSLQYWEFNMSPSGDWNVYRMEAYRRVGFQEETRIQQLPFDVQKVANGISLLAGIDLSVLDLPEQEQELGIAAVVRAKDESETYWALVHPGPQPDFHLRESFILVLGE